MTNSSITQIRDLQDKTTLKGVYLFLSISISLLIFKTILGVEIIPLLINEPPISIYLSILSLATILSALFYYVQLNRFLLKILIKIYRKSRNYPEYKDISLSNSLDHIFITPERKKFGSKLFFSLTLFLFLITFIGEAIEVFIFILVFMVISFSLLIPLLVTDWKLLLQRVKMIYFMKHFIQENKILKKKGENPVEQFILNLRKNLWFEAKSSFSQFLDEYLTVISEPIHKYIPYGELIEEFYDFVLTIYDGLDHFKKQPRHEIANFFFDKFNLDISAGTPKSDRYLLDYINSIKSSFSYIQNFANKLISWDEWLIRYVFKKEHIELDQIIKQINIMINLFDKNNEYTTLKNKQRLSKSEDVREPQIRKLKEEIYTQYQKIIMSFTNLENTLILLNIRDFFKKDLLEEYLKKLRETVYFLEVDLKLKKRMTKKEYQDVFTAISETLKFLIQNYEKLNYQYDISMIFQHIDHLNKFRYDLDKFNIEVDFSKSYRIRFKLNSDLEIIIPFMQEGLFSRKIKDIRTANPNIDFEKQTRVIYEYLKKCSSEFNLKIEDEAFWKAT